MKILLPFFILFSFFTGFTQTNQFPINPYQQEFANAYNQYPDVPKGLLEAVSFTMTRFQHLQNVEQSCVGLPKTYGVMGLTLDGQNYFRDNLNYISQVSGISVADIINIPEQNILAFAAAYHQQLTYLSPFQYQEQNVAHILTQLSELPITGLPQDFALNAHLYGVLSFMTDSKMQQYYHFPNPNFDLVKVFGEENLKVLQSSKIVMVNQNIEGDEQTIYKKSTINNKSADYPPALQNLTPCNYSSRSGTAISAVTVHTIQGSYAGAISWAHNCSVPANVSYHYVLRSSDGQVTQVVLELNKAWHVGSENPYTIGMEHEGFVNDSSWYTAAMYQSSADVVRDITQSGYGISPLRTAYFPWAHTTNYNASSIPGSCVKIKGHQHYPNQSHTDPGSNWDWKYYDNLINNTTPITIVTSSTGTITDNGGSTGNYTGERDLILIQPSISAIITLNTVQFDVENTWDYLYIYDGATTSAPLLGYYTGTSIPTSFTSTGGSLLLEMRSDCATDAPGFEFNFSSTAPDVIPPTTGISSSPSPFATTDFTSNFTDVDNVGGSGVMHQFYNVSDYNTTEWRANNDNGFFNDDFDTIINPDWIDSSGVWVINGGELKQTDQANTNSNIYAAFNQNNNAKYLYHYQARIYGTGSNKRAGFHYMSDDASLPNRGNSYFVWFRQDNGKLQFYSVTNDVFTLEKDVVFNFNAGQQYDYKIVYDKSTGTTDVYVDDVYVSSWTDTTPLTVGNYVSFRSGDCVYDVDELRIYKDRTSSELITVGSGIINDIRYENNPTTSGMIRSIAIDTAHNISLVAVEMVDVDFLTTAINQELGSKIKVYPNPTTKSVTIEFTEPKTGELLLRDITGKTIKKIVLNATNKLTLSLEDVAKGAYILSYDNQLIKLIKQ
jgi:N-acetyl-anhydromuramyl-L-alanine amidase AmpD